jgi:hypothetical protein
VDLRHKLSHLTLYVIKNGLVEGHGAVKIGLQALNFMASVRKPTIPTERPPLVSEVSANFL